jgi:hypothetical protein
VVTVMMMLVMMACMVGGGLWFRRRHHPADRPRGSTQARRARMSGSAHEEVG